MSGPAHLAPKINFKEIKKPPDGKQLKTVS